MEPENKKDLQIKVVTLLKSKRKELKMTMDDVAEQTGIKISNICRIETGQQNIRLQTLENFAKVYNVDVEIKLKNKKREKNNTKIC